ncbi:MAG: hypothetical protein AAFX94_15325, partial [Myxococcota bacterium]
MPRFLDSFDQVIHTLFDDYEFALNVGESLYDRTEVGLVQAVLRAIDVVLDAHGYDLNDREYYQKPEWTGVTTTAKEAFDFLRRRPANWTPFSWRERWHEGAACVFRLDGSKMLTPKALADEFSRVVLKGFEPWDRRLATLGGILRGESPGPSPPYTIRWESWLTSMTALRDYWDRIVEIIQDHGPGGTHDSRVHLRLPRFAPARARGAVIFG